jgi:hypothetical protein
LLDLKPQGLGLDDTESTNRLLNFDFLLAVPGGVSSRKHPETSNKYFRKSNKTETTKRFFPYKKRT